MESPRPPTGTNERWAADYILSSTLAEKLEPPPLPGVWEVDAPERRLLEPGRPSELRVVEKAKKTRGLKAPSGRARALHTFFHHELQAAELMAWAVLAFPDAPNAFRLGLLKIALDEMRHMHLYKIEIERLGHQIGDFSVRDWFWDRVPTSTTPAAFVATMGLGFESANLEHSATFAERFRAAGDEAGAHVQEIVGREEIAHVRFGLHWFREFTGGVDFVTWQRAMPEPLSPLLMRGRVLDRATRARAGFPDRFLDELEKWTPELLGF